MREVTVLLAAEIEIQRVYEQREGFREGAGEEFDRALRHAFQQLLANPRLGPDAGGGSGVCSCGATTKRFSTLSWGIGS